ncbi:MAG: hypothetical protein AB7V50_03950 [Vampirovibrionia bacterium]
MLKKIKNLVFILTILIICTNACEKKHVNADNINKKIDQLISKGQYDEAFI